MTHRNRATTSRTAVLVAGVATLLAGAPVAAQRATLERVEELARLGRPEEARTVLLEWWNGPREDAARRDLQQGLWLRGRLTVDPVQAELDYQRLVVLYPRGLYTARALERLAQSAHAMGDAEGASRYVANLARDYPRTPERERAEAWLRAAGPAPPAPDAPRTAAGGPRSDGSPSGAPASGRGTQPAAGGGAAGAAGGRPAGPDTGPATPSAGAGTYYVQLGAFAEEDRAMALYDEVRAAGFEVRIVRVEGSRFLHVRFGRFAARADAADELERLTAVGINAALVRDERAESPIR